MIKLLFLLLFTFFSFTFGEDNLGKQSLIKLSKRLESNNISSRVVTYNVKNTQAPKKKKKPTNMAKKTIVTQPQIATKNEIVTIETNDEEALPIFIPTINILSLEPTSNELAETDISPQLFLGVAANHLPLPKSRINPSSTISSWLSGFIQWKFLEISAGMSRFSENDMSGSLAFTSSNTESYYGQIDLKTSISDNLWIKLGYLIIKSDGTLAYASLNKATIEGFYIGLSHQLSDALIISTGFFPKLNNTYRLDNISTEKMPEQYQPDNTFQSSIDYGVFIFSLKYNILSI